MIERKGKNIKWSNDFFSFAMIEQNINDRTLSDQSYMFWLKIYRKNTFNTSFIFKNNLQSNRKLFLNSINELLDQKSDLEYEIFDRKGLKKKFKVKMIRDVINLVLCLFFICNCMWFYEVFLFRYRYILLNSRILILFEMSWLIEILFSSKESVTARSISN